MKKAPPSVPYWAPQRILITPEQRARSLRNHEEQVARNKARMDAFNATIAQRHAEGIDKALQKAAARFLPPGQSLTAPATLDLVRWPYTDTQGHMQGLSHAVREMVIDQDVLCRWCMAVPATTVDHVRPTSRGGTHDPRNLVGACNPCNSIKSNFLPKELGWVLNLPLRAFGYIDAR